MNIPPFVTLQRDGSGQPIVRERSTREGAEETARAIKHVWRCHGYQNVTAEPYIAVASRKTQLGCGAVWGVRTNLVNGLPPRTR